VCAVPIIFSHTEEDSSADEVIAWLQHKGEIPTRFSGRDIIDKPVSIKISKENTVFNHENNSMFRALFEGKTQESVWFRRWGDSDNTIRKLYQDELSENEKVKLSLLTYAHLNDERKRFDDWFINRVSVLHGSLNSHGFNDVNKLEILNWAAEAGLDIPETLVTNTKYEALEFLKEKGRIVCKSISEGFNFLTEKDQTYLMYTEEVTDEDLQSMSDKFAMTLFQELLDKEFEIRVSFLDGQFYSMAILSQENPKTEIDFRRYDYTNPNRYMPFSIPAKVKEALMKLMDRLNLQSAAIDIVYTTEKEYVFLEVNPVGQFGMVSKPCNYYLEEKIADYLIKLERKRG
jgi:ATP-GRASP peptide maturase of grasp-with-spasm system